MLILREPVLIQLDRRQLVQSIYFTWALLIYLLSKSPVINVEKCEHSNKAKKKIKNKKEVRKASREEGGKKGDSAYGEYVGLLMFFNYN